MYDSGWMNSDLSTDVKTARWEETRKDFSQGRKCTFDLSLSRKEVCVSSVVTIDRSIGEKFASCSIVVK